MIRLVLLVAVVAVLAYAAWRWRRDRRDDALARARSAFFLVSPTPPGRGPASDRMRTISLADGVFRMRIPGDWKEQPTSNAYRTLASSGRLFHAEVEARPRPGITPAVLAEELQASPEARDGRIDVLPDDRVLLKHVRAGPPGADVGLTYCWTLATVRSGDITVSAHISFAVPLEAADAITLDDLALVEREIRDAEVRGLSGIEDDRPR